MKYQFDTVAVPAADLAVCQAYTTPAGIPDRIDAMYATLYAWLDNADVRKTGHNCVIYDEFGPEGMRMRAGFPVSGPFADGAQVKSIALGAGRAAHTRHVGPYSGLPGAHAALNRWCEEERLNRLGWAREVYSHRGDDEAGFVTEVYVGIDG